MGNINNNNKRVLSLKNRSGHAQDHGNFSRRGFLRNLGLVGTGAFVLNRMPVTAAGFSPLSMALDAAEEDRVLVMIRLKGGNDGLNTIIPVHDFGTYQAKRPSIYIPRAETVSLTSTLALHPQLQKLESLWNDGEMRVVQNVGYPEQNLSHFRSSDIWASTSDADETVSSGVFGRYLNETYPDFLTSPPETPPAIQIGGPGNLLFNNEDDFNYAISTENPTQLYQIARSGQLFDTTDVPECTYGEQLKYVRAVANTTFRYAGVLAEAYDNGSNDPSIEYMNDRLGDQLALIARMLKGGLKTRLFVVEIDGFDTHANQPDDHARKMQSIASSVSSFFSDLEKGGQRERVLAMTFSEFGRRIEQNGSQGTDHGAAAPVMLFGPGLNGNGVAGGLPDLQDTDRAGNLKYRVDFRSIYATVLSRWLCIDGSFVDELMGDSFARMDELGLACAGTTSTSEAAASAGLTVKSYLSGPDLVLEYDLPASANVTVRLFDTTGRVVATPFNGRRQAGAQVQRLRLSAASWTAGIYVVSLETGGRAYSNKLGMFR